MYRLIYRPLMRDNLIHIINLCVHVYAQIMIYIITQIHNHMSVWCSRNAKQKATMVTTFGADTGCVSDL